MVSLAIVGARTFMNYDLLCSEVKRQCLEWDIKLTDIACIVEGHCQGADMLGEKFAAQHHIKTLVFKPD